MKNIIITLIPITSLAFPANAQTVFSDNFDTYGFHSDLSTSQISDGSTLGPWSVDYNSASGDLYGRHSALNRNYLYFNSNSHSTGDGVTISSSWNAPSTGSYELLFSMASEALNSDPANSQLTVLIDSIPYIFEVTPGTSNNDNWTTHRVTFNVSAGSHTISFQDTTFNPGSSTPSPSFESVAIRVIPEPSSTALLALGALGILARRRR